MSVCVRLCAGVCVSLQVHVQGGEPQAWWAEPGFRSCGQASRPERA